MDITKICLGCMEEKGDATTCPHCGYNTSGESEASIFLNPGTVLAGKYMIGKVLGQGGFGITYLAWDINLDIRIAVKEFFPQGLVSRLPGKNTVASYTGAGKDQFSSGVESFLKEAKTLARFENHPNIVTVRDFFKENDTAYVVMSYLQGITLEEFIVEQGGTISFALVQKIVVPVIDALKEVHKSGVLHRDISPENIFIDTNGRVILIDFGAARQKLQQQSRSMSVIMKAGYSPLEQYQSRGEQGPWTDIYALCATIYRAIAGSRPPEAFDRLDNDILQPPSKLGVEIEPEQENVLLKGLAVKAKDRYQLAEELQKELMNLPASGSMVLEKPEYVSANLGSTPDESKFIKEQNILESSGREQHDKKAEKTYQQAGVFAIVKILISKMKDNYNITINNPVKKRRVLIISLSFLLPVIILSALIAAHYHYPVSEITINDAELVLEAKIDEVQINPIIKPSFISNRNLTYLSNNPDIAEVSQDGVITALNKGSATITVKAIGDNVSTSFNVEVVNPTIDWNGGLYKGELEDGLPHGEGTWEHSNGEYYTGQWNEGNYHGQGEWYHPSGERYSGRWRNGTYHGLGVWHHPSGEQYEGYWVSGIFNGSGKWIGPDGDSFEGTFKEGKWDGFGRYTHADGSLEKGHWVGGVKSKNYVASIDALIKGPKFFESGYHTPEANKRVYRSKFDRNNSRYISWELDFIFSPEVKNSDMKYTWIYYNPDGSVNHRYSSSANKYWFRNTHHGAGWDSKGNWQKGTYRFVFILDGKTVASGNFEVY